MVIPKTLARTILLALVLGLAGCAPPGIRPGATAHWSTKDGRYWTWTQVLEHGCADWMADEGYAEMLLLVNSQCKDTRRYGSPKEPGISYLTFQDHLVFRHYWPWTDEIWYERMGLGTKDESLPTKPCGYALSPSQLSQLRILAQEAYDDTRTAAEERVLARIIERLAVVGNGPLDSSYEGCTDLPVEGADPPSVDVWAAE